LVPVFITFFCPQNKRNLEVNLQAPMKKITLLISIFVIVICMNGNAQRISHLYSSDILQHSPKADIPRSAAPNIWIPHRGSNTGTFANKLSIWHINQTPYRIDSTHGRLWDFNSNAFYAEPSEKSICDYNPQNDLQAILDFKLVNENWQPDMKEIRTYDSNHHVLTWQLQSFNSSGGTWSDVWRIVYSYFPEGRLRSYKKESKAGNSWTLEESQSYTYDAAGNVTSVCSRLPLGYYQAIDSVQEFYTYNNANKPVLHQGMVWDGQSWLNGYSFQELSDYDSLNREVALTNKEYQNLDWVNKYGALKAYNATGDLSVSALQEWTGGVWDSTSRTDYAYNPTHKMTAQLVQIKNSNGWINTELDSVVYDGSDREILSRQWHWEPASGWVSYSRSFHYYPAGKEGNLYEAWSGGSWYPVQKRWLTWNEDSSIQAIQAYSEFRYLPSSTDVQFADSVDLFFQTTTRILSDQEADEFLLYPNPASDFLYMHSGKNPDSPLLRMELRDLQGKKVKELSIPPGQSREIKIPLAGIQPGIYLLKADFGKGYRCRKIEILHP